MQRILPISEDKKKYLQEKVDKLRENVQEKMDKLTNSKYMLF